VNTKVEFSQFEALLLARSDRPRLSLVFILCWVAHCDGSIASEEASLIAEATADSLSSHERNVLFGAARAANVLDVQLALEFVRAADASMHVPCLQLAISVALADGYLRTVENHCIRLIADALGLGIPGLHAAFREMTGHDFPNAGDPSDPVWWDARKSTTRASSRERDFEILGLQPGSNVDDIRTAFRRLARVHHPDRYASAGPEAIRAASLQFMRIRAAYERLVS
jgi:DnaJ like chaperone protein